MKVDLDIGAVRRSVLVVLLVLVGCNGGDDGAASTTAPPETSTTVEPTTTTAAPDPFSVPDDPADIHAAYVEAVLAELERINGDALRLAISEGLSPTVREMIESIYTRDLGFDQLDILVDDSIAGFPGTNRPPGDVGATVTSMFAAGTSCISADVLLDFSAVAISGPEAAATRVELRPPVGGEPSNRTPWVYSVRQPLRGENSPPEPCAGP